MADCELVIHSLKYSLGIYAMPCAILMEIIQQWICQTVPELMDNAFYRGEIQELSVIPDCDEWYGRKSTLKGSIGKSFDSGWVWTRQLKKDNSWSWLQNPHGLLYCDIFIYNALIRECLNSWFSTTEWISSNLKKIYRERN